ncbi:hypothetical protein [Streptomyces sp. NPDC127092]|uniref:hypothetical protein n=1 Tax=Streptomyces sp. NPDC127092 TaxID=3347135 RepID=UPI003654F262
MDMPTGARWLAIGLGALLVLANAPAPRRLRADEPAVRLAAWLDVSDALSIASLLLSSLLDSTVLFGVGCGIWGAATVVRIARVVRARRKLPSAPADSVRDGTGIDD